jgi:hypothetical protein
MTATDYELAHQELAEADADAHREAIRVWPADAWGVEIKRPASEKEEL